MWLCFWSKHLTWRRTVNKVLSLQKRDIKEPNRILSCICSFLKTECTLPSHCRWNECCWLSYCRVMFWWKSLHPGLRVHVTLTYNTQSTKEPDVIICPLNSLWVECLDLGESGFSLNNKASSYKPHITFNLWYISLNSFHRCLFLSLICCLDVFDNPCSC